jgi:DNA-binding transcriptional ArsR family regulator
MKPNQVVGALSALAHEHRLAVYRLLVERGPAGLAAGVVAERLAVAPSALTFHLQNLQRAELVTSRRVGRQIIYAADFAVMKGLVAFLTDNCCAESSAGGNCRPQTDHPKTVRKARKAA